MASASVVFGKVKGGQPAIDSTFSSQEVASGGVSTACPAQYNYAAITAIGGNVWVAFSTGTPDPSAASARFPLTMGATVSFKVIAGTKVGVLDRA